MQNKMLINGAWVDAQNSETWDVINPATEEKVVQVPFGDAKDAFAAIEAAHKAQPEWAAMTAYERSDLLMRVASLIRERVEDIAPVMTLECGKPLIEARLEWASSAALFEWFAEEGKRAYGRTVPARVPGKRLLVIPEPVGVVATITAWNFPAVLPARKWAAALAAGCTVVGRPSELTPLSAMVLVNIMVEAGIPPGVINLVNGEPESIGKAFLESPLVDKVSFTGSQRVGRILMRAAADGIKRLALELGGSAPVLVFNDVDVEAAAMQAVKGKFRNNGQVCISPNRIYVHQPIFNDFLEAAKANTELLVVGEGLQEGVTTGPLVTAAGRDKVELFVQDALQKGAQLVTGGRRPPAFERGYFFEPTILTNVTPDMRISYDEVFGPAMPVNTFQSFEEAIQLANETPYGLTGYVITNDMSTAIRAYEGLKFGVIGVNDFVPATPEAPFGGMKLSGFGREGSQEGLHEYLETKFVSIAL
jgi:succinate-semialdehyde dehydrogenase/glutarate-semialdehyde dehydrogenase